MASNPSNDFRFRLGVIINTRHIGDMRELHIDCVSGISGDMFLAAMIDLGLKPGDLRHDLALLGLPDPYEIKVARGQRCAIAGVHVQVHVPAHHAHDHGHDHGHHHHGHGGHSHSHDHHGRSFTAIRDMIESSALHGTVKQRAVAVFRRIGEAEAAIHGKTIEQIHFHEVGAVDSIVDIVGACIAMERMGIDRVTASPPVDGTGTIHCAHGTYPVPAPATLAILRGIPLTQIDVPHELITPTGAALLAEFASAFHPLRNFAVDKIGYGLGTRDFPDRANVLRLVMGRSVGEVAGMAGAEQEEVVVLTTQIDDQSPEELACAVELLRDAGALDVILTPCAMKKGRNGQRLEVIGGPDQEARLAEMIFIHTSAFGLRTERLKRWKLKREIIKVGTPYGEIRVKIGKLGGRVMQRRPEYEDCRAAAERHGVAVGEVFRAAVASMLPAAG